MGPFGPNTGPFDEVEGSAVSIMRVANGFLEGRMGWQYASEGLECTPELGNE